MHRFGDLALEILDEREAFQAQVQLSASLPQVEVVEDGENLIITLKECVTKHYLLQFPGIEIRFLSS